LLLEVNPKRGAILASAKPRRLRHVTLCGSKPRSRARDVWPFFPGGSNLFREERADHAPTTWRDSRLTKLGWLQRAFNPLNGHKSWTRLWSEINPRASSWSKLSRGCEYLWTDRSRPWEPCTSVRDEVTSREGTNQTR
jgi:hypothetical protein